MLLSPSSRDDGQWTVVDGTGKSVSPENFPDREAAIQWIVDSGHAVYDSQGEHVEPRNAR